ncbi:Prp18 domain containing protein, putative [Leishmania donovani]|uniref:Pre-mRNA-splicing factor 18 n=1 Tax=Leishmania donovani TaxID=5661 RepID=A0A3Q8ICC8_LEIDO|nr:Prp18 domain containing protein, putative [Leishmania donovani]
MSFEGLQGLLKKKKQEQRQGASDGPAAAAAAAANASAHTQALAGSATAAHKSATPTNTAHAAPNGGGGSSGNGGSGSTTYDPYAAALQSVQILQQQQQQEQQGMLSSTTAGQKRPREDMVQASKLVGAVHTSNGSSAAEASDELNVRSGASASTPPTASLNAPVVPSVKSDDDVLAQREMGVAVLQMCLTKLEHYWAAERASSKALASTCYSVTATAPVPAVPQPQHQPSSAGALLESSDSLPALSSLLSIPRALRDYLVAQFVAPNPGATRATGLPEMTVLDREFELLAELKAEMEAEPPNEAVDSASTVDTKAHQVPEEQRQLAELLCALWYLVALFWQHSLDPHQRNGRSCAASTAMPREGPLAPAQQGWSPAVYLGLQNALPADVRLLQGRAIAEEVDRWRALARTRQNALELLSYVCSDYDTSAAASSPSTTAAGFIIPSDLRKNLHTMVVRHLQQERNFMAVRQDYVDITMGTANWKLGLFSGGEVHMRRSMERVERNRIAHLLNNEHATQLLQAVRELTIFVEHHALARTSPFFCPACATSTMAA